MHVSMQQQQQLSDDIEHSMLPSIVNGAEKQSDCTAANRSNITFWLMVRYKKNCILTPLIEKKLLSPTPIDGGPSQ